MSQTDAVSWHIERRGLVALLVLGPGVNATAATARCLTDAVRQLMNDDDTTRVIVIAGPGLGLSAKSVLPLPAQSSFSLGEARSQAADGAELARAIWAGTKPVIVAAEGEVAEHGLALLALADIAVAATDAALSCGFVMQGRVPGWGLMWTLAQKVGAARAQEMLLSGEVLSGEQAARMGLVHRVAAPGRALEVAVEEAERLASLPPVTLTLLKGALVSAMNSVSVAVRHEVDLNPLVRTTADHQEAVAAFLEKRKPQFRGE